MTRIFTDGAEFGDLLFWDVAGTTVISNTIYRSGLYSYRPSGTAYKNIPNLSELYIRFAWYNTSFGWTYVIGFNQSITTLCDFYHLVTGELQARVNGVAVATSSSAYSRNQWHLTETHLKIADSPDGIIDVKINGVLEIEYSGDTKPGSETYVDALKFSSSTYVYFDDFALNDTNGTTDNNWCGNGYVIKITPSGSGTINQWLNSGSTSGSSNYEYVDEYPADEDTTTVRASGSSIGDKDKYAMTTITGSDKIIKRIFPECRAKKTSSNERYVKIGYLPDGGTDQLSGSIVLTTNYTAIVGTSASANPVTGTAWTIEDIDKLEYVIEVA